MNSMGWMVQSLVTRPWRETPAVRGEIPAWEPANQSRNPQKPAPPSSGRARTVFVGPLASNRPALNYVAGSRERARAMIPAGGSTMGLQQRAGSPATAFSALPPGVADAASVYQRLREIEKSHLALMARHNLLAEWTPEIRETVLAARKHIHETSAAREKFRAALV